MKRLLEACIGGEPFRKRDKFSIFIVAQIGRAAGIERRRGRCGKENIVVEQGEHFEAVTVDIALGNGDKNGVQRAFIQHVQQGFVGAHRQIHFQIRTT